MAKHSYVEVLGHALAHGDLFTVESASACELERVSSIRKPQVVAGVWQARIGNDLADLIVPTENKKKQNTVIPQSRRLISDVSCTQ